MKNTRLVGLFDDLWKLFEVYRGRPLLQQPDGRTPPRTAVIMGAQVLRGGRPSPALEARVEHAARLYLRGELDLLVPTGGMGDYPPREAVLMMNILRGADVPREAILLEDEAISTWDSAVRLEKLLWGQGMYEVRIITDPLHCVRTVWAFGEVGIGGWAEPAYENPMWGKPWSRRGQLAREAVALVWYRVKYRAGSHSRP